MSTTCISSPSTSGSATTSTTRSSVTLAARLCDQGRLLEARALLDLVLASRVPTDQADRAESQSILGLVLARLGAMTEAEDLLVVGADALVAVGDIRRARVAELRRVEWLLLQGRPADALTHLNTINDDGCYALLLRGAALQVLGASHAAGEVAGRARAAAERAGDRFHHALVLMITGTEAGTTLDDLGVVEPPAVFAGWRVGDSYSAAG